MHFCPALKVIFFTSFHSLSNKWTHIFVFIHFCSSSQSFLTRSSTSMLYLFFCSPVWIVFLLIWFTFIVKPLFCGVKRHFWKTRCCLFERRGWKRIIVEEKQFFFVKELKFLFPNDCHHNAPDEGCSRQSSRVKCLCAFGCFSPTSSSLCYRSTDGL